MHWFSECIPAVTSGFADPQYNGEWKEDGECYENVQYKHVDNELYLFQVPFISYLTIVANTKCGSSDSWIFVDFGKGWYTLPDGDGPMSGSVEYISCPEGQSVTSWADWYQIHYNNLVMVLCGALMILCAITFVVRQKQQAPYVVVKHLDTDTDCESECDVEAKPMIPWYGIFIIIRIHQMHELSLFVVFRKNPVSKAKITESKLTWIIRFGSLFLFLFIWLQWAVPVFVRELNSFLYLCPNSMGNTISIYECDFVFFCIVRIEFVISPNSWWYRFGSMLFSYRFSIPHRALNMLMIQWLPCNLAVCGGIEAVFFINEWWVYVLWVNSPTMCSIEHNIERFRVSLYWVLLWSDYKIKSKWRMKGRSWKKTKWKSLDFRWFVMCARHDVISWRSVMLSLSSKYVIVDAFCFFN